MRLLFEFSLYKGNIFPALSGVSFLSTEDKKRKIVWFGHKFFIIVIVIIIKVL